MGFERVWGWSEAPNFHIVGIKYIDYPPDEYAFQSLRAPPPIYMQTAVGVDNVFLKFEWWMPPREPVSELVPCIKIMVIAITVVFLCV